MNIERLISDALNEASTVSEEELRASMSLDYKEQMYHWPDQHEFDRKASRTLSEALLGFKLF